MKRRFGWDSAGILFSVICMIHCIAVPLFLVLFPVIGLEFLPKEDLTHAILFAFILGVAGFAFWSGYRVHGQKRPVIWMAIGLVIIVYATFFVHNQLGHFYEPVFAILGSVALIRAHYLNHVCKKCEHDHLTHHHADPTQTVHQHNAECAHGHVSGSTQQQQVELSLEQRVKASQNAHSNTQV